MMHDPIEPGDRMDPEAALRFPMGAASPLWLAFFGAAATASTWWWMSRWARELALDGAGGAVAAGALPAVPLETATFAPEDDDDLDDDHLIDDAVDEPVAAAAEAVAEAAGLVVDPLIEAPVAVAPEPAPLTAALEAASEATPEAAAEIAAEIADDLTRLVGVGPRLAASLAERGVTRFAQIAAWSADDLAEVDKALNLRGRAGRDAWISQARRLASA